MMQVWDGVGDSGRGMYRSLVRFRTAEKCCVAPKRLCMGSCEVRWAGGGMVRSEGRAGRDCTSQVDIDKPCLH